MIDSETNDALDFLRDAFRSRRVSLKDIGGRTGVHVSQVSRILSGDIRRVSVNVKKICKFANELSVGMRPKRDLNYLIETLKIVWDGTPEGAEALCGLLLAAHRFRHESTGLER